MSIRRCFMAWAKLGHRTASDLTKEDAGSVLGRCASFALALCRVPLALLAAEFALGARHAKSARRKIPRLGRPEAEGHGRRFRLVGQVQLLSADTAPTKVSCALKLGHSDRIIQNQTRKGSRRGKREHGQLMSLWAPHHMKVGGGAKPHVATARQDLAAAHLTADSHLGAVGLGTR